MNFYRESILWLSLGLLPLAIYLYYSGRLELSRMRSLVDAPIEGRRLRWLGWALMLCVFFLIVFSAARPRWEYEEKALDLKGADILIAVDVSRSMLAEDLSPNRLTVVRRGLEDLVSQLAFERVGLIPFAGQAFLQCPLTRDYAAIRQFLKSFSPDLIPSSGSSIADAIDLARQVFGELKVSNRKVLLVLSDGENQSRDPLPSARKAAEEGIEIYSFAVATAAGAPIPSNSGGLIRDSNGQLVISRLDSKSLQEIAKIGSGEYRQLRSALWDWQWFVRKVSADTQSQEARKSSERVWKETYFWFSLLALLVLLVDGLFDLTRATKT